MAKAKKARKKAAEEAPDVAAAPTGLDALSAEHDEVNPDAPPDRMIQWAKTLASRARSYSSELKRAKVDPKVADQITERILLLRDAQTQWLKAQSRTNVNELKTVRDKALERRSDLFHGLRYFGRKKAAVQRELDLIAEGSGDADTVQDLVGLVRIAREEKDLLEGTELTPKLIGEAESYGKQLDALTEAPDGRPEAIEALRKRNRAFWHLEELCSDVCNAGRFVFRRDPKKAALFVGYRTALRRTRPSASATPTE